MPRLQTNRFPSVIRFYFTLIAVLFSPRVMQAQSIEYARSIIGELCSPAMYGRGYSMRGDSIAAAFIEKEFIGSGLVPLSGSYSQEFKIPVNVFPGEISCRLNENILVPGEDFLVSPSSPAGLGEYKVIPLTPSIMKSGKKFNNFLGNSGQKAILINKNDFASAPDSIRKMLDRLTLYLANEKLYDPAVILVADTGKLTWSSATFTDERPVIYLKKLPSDKLKKVFFRIDQKFIPACQTRNVMGMIKSAAKPDSFLVVTAHYDHLGMMGNILFPGANDNASGTAMMLDLARELNDARDSLNYSILFIAFSGEECGLLGSKYFSEHPVIDLKKIRFLINLDLAGTGDDGITVVNATVFKSEFDLLNKINLENGYIPAIKSRGEACNSDHCYLYMKGVPCFYFYTLGGITAYHDIYDKAETLPLTAYQNYFALLKRFIMRIGPANRN